MFRLNLVAKKSIWLKWALLWSCIIESIVFNAVVSKPHHDQYSVSRSIHNTVIERTWRRSVWIWMWHTRVIYQKDSSARFLRPSVYRLSWIYYTFVMGLTAHAMNDGESNIIIEWIRMKTHGETHTILYKLLQIVNRQSS